LDIPGVSPAEAAGLGIAVATGTAVGAGVGTAVTTGLGVGRGVGFGVGLGVGLGVGAEMTTGVGVTFLSVAVRRPAPVPLVAVNRYVHDPAGSFVETANFTPVVYAVPEPDIGKVPTPGMTTRTAEGAHPVLSV
jgi:hypothetical protein